MKKYTQKEIKQLIVQGTAQDITHHSTADYIKGLFPIGVSIGVYGYNSALLEDKEGALYAITARTSALFMYL